MCGFAVVCRGGCIAGVLWLCLILTACRLNNVCAFKMKVLNGGDNVTLRIWANGKTQVC